MVYPKSVRPLQKHTILLYEGDFARLQLFYKHKNATARVIRKIVADHLEEMEMEVAAKRYRMGLEP